MLSGESRISTLRKRVLDRKRARGNAPISVSPRVVAKAILSLPSDISAQLRSGHLTKAALEACAFEIDELEILAGRPVNEPDKPTHDSLEKPLADALKSLGPTPGQTGHCELDLIPLYKKGISGLLSDLKAKESSLPEGEGRDAIKSFSLALEGLSTMIRNAASCMEKSLEQADAGRKAELRESLESCRRVATAPAESFLDALHLLWFATMGTQYAGNAGLVVAGRIDRRLIGFYRKDIASGVLTESKALLLLENLYLLLNDFVSDGLATSIMVGGRGPDGKDTANELSYLCLEALRRSNLCYPTVGVCWHKGTPEKLTDLAVELISKGYTTPAFFGDELIQRGLKHYGVPEADAGEYINSTCVEITPCGSSNVWVASPYFNLSKLLLDEIAAQAEADSKSTATFEKFLEVYFARLAKQIEAAAVVERNSRELRARNGGKPLQSVFTRDCIGRAKDIDRGGALYNWIECSFVGIANLADSLMVIKREVFEGKMPFAKLKTLLDSDFKGEEDLRLKFLNVHPKYGTANDEVDSLIGLSVKHFSEECGRHSMPPDDTHFIPGAFCWIMHERLGRDCGATPDGRLAGFPFADGAGPAQGRERKGPTASVLSTSSWDHSRMIGGTALNMKFSSGLFQGGKGVSGLKSLILTYLERGGLETQVNVVDRETLLKAKENPEEYRDLVVRIGGYTDYFTRLSPQMQSEVLLRTEFSKF